MRARTWGLVFLAPLLSCSLLTPLGDLSGDAATNDGGSDVITTSDAPVDAPSEVGPADASFCPVLDAGSVFCDDFDDSDASVFPKWSKLVASNGGAVTRADSDASAPFCVETTLPFNDAGPQAQLQKTLIGAATTRVTYTYRVRVVRFPSSGKRFNLSPVELQGSAASGGTNFLAVASTGSSFTEQFPVDGGGFTTSPHLLTQGIVLGQWTTIRLVWTIGDAGTSMAVSFDGVPVTASFPLDPRTVFTTPVVGAGLSYEDPQADGADVQIDDVAITIE